MTVSVIGEIELGAAIPGAVAALALAIPDLEAKIAALVAFKPPSISFEADLEMALAMVANLKTMIRLGIKPPSIEAQIQIMLSLLAALQANLAAIAAFKAVLSAKAFVYGFEGPTSAFGTELQNEIGSGFPGFPASEQTHALVLGTTTQAAYSAMAKVFVGF
jgi:hypothetical protein